MTTELGAAFNYTDFGGLATLRREAGQDTPEARRAVAKQFEALFLSMMLSEMRSAASVEGGLIDSDQLDSHQDMHDRQLALALSQGGGIGLAESILRQLGGAPASDSAAGPNAAGAPVEIHALRRYMGPSRSGTAVPGDRGVAGSSRGAAAASKSAGAALQSTGVGGSTGESADIGASPAQFVAAALPHARRAAAALGVSPDVLVAQAALETGWGRHMIRDGAGDSSFNVFGIKAGGSWTGRRMTVSTLEFVDGVPERRREAFRAYGSLEDGFNDYIALIGSRPRYREALEAGDAEGYVRALQAGGYSTDPHYADKILAILRGGLPGAAAPPESTQAAAAGADNDTTGLTSGIALAAGGDES